MADPFSTTAGIVGAVGAGVNAFQSLFGSNEPSQWQKDTYQNEREWQRYVNDRNVELQREFAQNGIRWKVEDAKRAGLHPVAALGGGGASFSPISVGSTAPADAPRNTGVGDALMDMGQNISRATRATSTQSERQALQMNELQLENQTLQNTLLKHQIVKLTQPSQIGPPMPEEKKIHSDIGYTTTKTGGLAPVPSEAFADRAEDQWLPQMAWAARNLLVPVTPDRDPGDGKAWNWNPLRFEFEAKPVPKDQPWDISTYELARRYFSGSPSYQGPLNRRSKYGISQAPYGPWPKGKAPFGPWKK